MTDTESHTDTPGTPPRPTDTRMMWVMMIGCCLAIPLALILGGASLAGLAGASPWLIGLAVVLAIALVITHRVSRGPGCDQPDHHD
ncbi:MAG: hypothetical protein M5T61_15915 [Acidimicrobiia bacterium]|jgi:uncharacterized membrane protein YgaE (UPF0421/DUF939 family)|nr:hypothetical protein [Acidimicrobiia bacterium]